MVSIALIVCLFFTRSHFVALAGLRLTGILSASHVLDRGYHAQPFELFKNYVCMSVSVCTYVHVCAGARRGQRHRLS